jgi:chromosome segregation ATPase
MSAKLHHSLLNGVCHLYVKPVFEIAGRQCQPRPEGTSIMTETLEDQHSKAKSRYRNSQQHLASMETKYRHQPRKVESLRRQFKHEESILKSIVEKYELAKDMLKRNRETHRRCSRSGRQLGPGTARQRPRL